MGTRFMDICKLGIWGIGGIGKTTIAGALLKKYSRHFEGVYFAQNVREAEKTGRLAPLRQELLSTLLNDGNAKIIPSIGLYFESKRLTRKKVLIVFWWCYASKTNRISNWRTRLVCFRESNNNNNKRQSSTYKLSGQ